MQYKTHVPGLKKQLYANARFSLPSYKTMEKKIHESNVPKMD